MSDEVSVVGGYIPKVDPNYVKWGHYNTIEKIISSNAFYAGWLTGLPGCGKTQLVEQVCANLGKRLFRLNFTINTDENDLIGAQRLKDGSTTIQYGPLVEAAKCGGIVLCDDIDQAHPNKILCMQAILEKKPIHVKATNEYFYPQKGFNIIATSNTKGRGDDNGQFAGINILNKAMLDRFGWMLTQDYPSKEIEEEILAQYYIQYNFIDKGLSANDLTSKESKESGDFLNRICDWSAQIRMAYDNKAFEEVVSLRTCINIIQSYAIFGNKELALSMACEKFPDSAKASFLDIYAALDDTVDMSQQNNTDTNGEPLPNPNIVGSSKIYNTI